MALAETNRIEFKERLTRDLDIEKEVVAFLNYREGGILYIGIDKTGKAVGVEDIDGDMLKIKDRIRNNISPSPMGLFEVSTEKIDGVDVIRVFVASGSETPYYKSAYGMSIKGCFIRVGSAAEPMTQDMIDDWYARRVRISLRNIPAPRQKLTFRILKLYYEAKGISLNKNFAENLDLLLPDGRFNYVAFLLADENNVSFKFAKYDSADRSKLSSVMEFGFTCILKATDQIIDRLKVENDIKSHKTYKERVNTPLWNEAAIREWVLNAMVHNDYTDEVPPKFELFSDHLEITSAGTLPNGLSKEDFYAGISKPRNKELMRVFCDVDLGESLGSGMTTIMKEYSPANFVFLPHFLRLSVPYKKQFSIENDYRNDELSIENEHRTENLSTENEHRKSMMRLLERRENIILLIKQNELISIKEIAAALHSSPATIMRTLQGMRHVVVHVGPTKKGRWEFI